MLITINDSGMLLEKIVAVDNGNQNKIPVIDNDCQQWKKFQLFIMVILLP